MFHSHIVRSLSLDRPVRVLDACAAPGGKTSAVLSALPGGSIVVANEFVPARAAVLKENIVKWGSPDVVVTRGDTSAFASMPETFDVIVADVPCSGEGMMRKEPHAVEQWSPALVEECASLQWHIIQNLWPSLRPGGWLIYSTCTFNRTEDELMVERIISDLGAESLEVPVEEWWGITPGIGTSAHCYRFIPGRTRGEGLFAALLGKPGGSSGRVLKQREKRESRAAIPGDVNDWLADPGRFTISASSSGRITAFPKDHAELLGLLSGYLDIIHEGVPLATVKGRDIIPAHALAMSTALRRDAFARVELDRSASLSYLRGDTVTLPPDTPRGFVAVCHGGYPLGWAKNLGSRTNNYYPVSYRIKIQ